MTLCNRNAVRRVAVRAVTIAALLLPVTGRAATLGATVTALNALDAGSRDHAAAPSATSAPPLSDSEAQGYGCLISGGVATGLTAFAGSDELIKIVAGGTIGPATPLAAAVALTGTVFASVCAVGALATPALMRLYNLYARGASWVAVP